MTSYPAMVMVTTETSGTDDLVLGAAVDSYRSFEDAVSDGDMAWGDTVRYVVEDSSARETGLATVVQSGPTLNRSSATQVVSTSGGSKINVAGGGATRVYVSLVKNDFVTRASDGQFEYDGTVSLDISEITTEKSANFNAEVFRFYPCDTTGGAFTATLPASPNGLDRIKFMDSGNNWSSNNLTISGNGNTIVGFDDFVCDINGKEVTLLFISGDEWKVAAA